jgi:hypothetical protein
MKEGVDGLLTLRENRFDCHAPVPRVRVEVVLVTFIELYPVVPKRLGPG